MTKTSAKSTNTKNTKTESKKKSKGNDDGGKKQTSKSNDNVASQEGKDPVPSSPVVARTGSYSRAENVLGKLREDNIGNFEVRARGLRLRHLESPMTKKGAITRGMLLGGVIGVVCGLLPGAAGWLDPAVSGLTVGLWCVLIGAVMGAIGGLLWRFDLSWPRSDDFGRLAAEEFRVVGEDPDAVRRANKVLGKGR